MPGDVVSNDPYANLEMVDASVAQVLYLWDLPQAAATRINVSENVTYLVESAHGLSVLRVHRPGYHSRRAIECEVVQTDLH